MKLKILILAVLIAACCYVNAQQTCHTPERIYPPVTAAMLAEAPKGNLCLDLFLQVDYDIVEYFGLDGAKDYAESLMAEMSVPYSDIGVDVSVTYDYVLQEKYTTGNSFEMLEQFRNATPVFSGDIAMLISFKSSGGIAFLDVVCKQTNPFKYAFSSVQPEFRPFREGYSWSVLVAAHEVAHCLGSPHTQACAWLVDGVPGRAIDGCVPSEGDCDDGPIPSSGGTLLSYCHINAVGTNFEKGFHPQVAALMRYNLAERCTTCDTPPDDDDPDPPVITCDGNTVFLDLILDAYPSETSYEVRDAFGNLVHESVPFNRSQVGEVISDTLCLPDGCYTYTIKDSTGLASVPCLDGYYYVADAFGEFGSGQDFAGMVDVRFCVGNPVEPKCEDVGLDADSLVSFANQDQVGGVSVAGEGLIKLQGNTWKAQPYEYVVTENTVLTGRVQVQSLGEIHGFSVVKNTRGLSLRNTIQFAGTQPWGTFYEVEGIESGNWVDVGIPIGQLIPPGTYSYIVLINDHDAPNPTAKTGFREFELCEEPGQQLKRAIDVRGELQDESLTQFKVIVEDIILRPYPNPVTDTLNLDYDVFWELYGPAGANIRNGYGRHVSFTGLPIGFYTLRVGNKAYKVVKN